MEDQGKTVLKAAYTHVAKKLLDGVTLHKLFGYDITGSRSHLTRFNGDEIIIIDEVSMIPCMFYREILRLKRRYPKIQLILAGDFYQLAPVGEEHIKFADLSALRNICEYKLELLVEKRANDDPQKELFALIKQNAKQVYFDPGNFNRIDKLLPLNLSYTNHTRLGVNRKCMVKYRPEDKSAYFKLPSSSSPRQDGENKYGQMTWVYRGLPVRCRKRVAKDAYGNKIEILNGMTFVVKDYTEKVITLTNNDQEFAIPRNDDFVYNFNPNYCMTIHASQGQTFDQPYGLYDVNLYDEKLLYVALSRSTRLSNIHVDFLSST